MLIHVHNQSKVKKFYLKSVHEATYNINAEELLKPTQITYKNTACKHTWFTNTLHTIQHSTLWQVKWKCLLSSVFKTDMKIIASISMPTKINQANKFELKISKHWNKLKQQSKTK
jgi:hypothetical protein